MISFIYDFSIQDFFQGAKITTLLHYFINLQRVNLLFCNINAKSRTNNALFAGESVLILFFFCLHICELAVSLVDSTTRNLQENIMKIKANKKESLNIFECEEM